MKLQTLELLQKYAEQNLFDLEESKKNGEHAVGFYCLYSPTELALAAGATALPLCGTKNEPIEAAETILPRNMCPLIKSSFGFAVKDSCPFLRFSDIIVADTTCDGKKKMFEIMQDYKEVYMLELPQKQDGDAIVNWTKEVVKLKDRIEKLTGNTITGEKLKETIKLLNTSRRKKRELLELAAENPPLLSGKEILEAQFKVGFFQKEEKVIEIVEKIIAEVKERAASGNNPAKKGAPRILLAGVPVGLGSDKVVNIIEDCGGQVVCMENCSSYKSTFQVDETCEPIEALSKAYLNIPCSVMSPNPFRYSFLDELVEKFKVDGVIDLTWQACHTFNVESYSVEKHLKEKHELPFLHLETDYSESDTEQLRVRVEAFLEIL